MCLEKKEMSEQEKETNNEREKKTEREGQQTQPQDQTKLICKLNASPTQHSEKEIGT